MVPLASTPTVFETMPDTMYLVETIAADATSMKINYVPLAMTSGVFLVDEGTAIEERISWNGTPTDNGDGTATFSDLGRGLGYGGGTAYAAAAATAYSHTGNSSTVRLVMAHEYLNKMMATDRDNTILSGKKLFMGGSGVWVYGDATELYLRSTTTAEKTLAQLAAGAGSDEKVRISIGDDTSDYLESKVIGGDGITLSVVNDEATETLNVAVDLKTSGGLAIESGQLKVDTSAISVMPTGASIPWHSKVAPSGYLLCYGQNVSRATYSALFSVIVPLMGVFTVTIASPAVFSLTAHTLLAGERIYFTTTGTLPTGLSVNTIYYVIAAGLTADAFQVSATLGGSAINTTGSQSGVHSAYSCPYGLGDGSTTFGIPDYRGRFGLGNDLMGGGSATTRVTSPTGASLGETAAGTEKVTLVTTDIPTGLHLVTASGIGGGGGNTVQNAFSGLTTFPAGSNGNGNCSTAPISNQASSAASTMGTTQVNNMPPYITENRIIKT